MHKDRIATLHTQVKNCIVLISVTLCRAVPIESIFVGIVYQKKYHYHGSHIGSRLVREYFDGLVFFYLNIASVSRCEISRLVS